MLTASIVIATKNRREDLRRALVSCLAQTPAVEVLVFDDGSTDGTAEMLRSEFPTVRVEHDGVSRGYIVRRNQGGEKASGDVIFSIDDDAEFSTPTVVADTLRDFCDERIGAVAIPFIDVLKSPQVKQAAPTTDDVWVTDQYIGTAHAIRRELFNQLGGYRVEMFHQVEEMDLCLRMFDAGSVVRLGTAPPILHHESPLRSLARIAKFDQRNRLLFAWWNVPWPWLAVHGPAALFGGLLRGVKKGVFWPVLVGSCRALYWMPLTWKLRRPVSAKRYWLHRQLKKRGPQRLAEVVANW